MYWTTFDYLAQKSTTVAVISLYTNHFELHLELQVEFLDEEEKKYVFAGFFLHNAMFVHGKALSL